MKLGNKYKCDKCGCDVEHPKSLTTFFQSGVAYHRRNPYGVRHMCLYCKQQFDLAFSGFFPYYNKIKKKSDKNLDNNFEESEKKYYENLLRKKEKIDKEIEEHNWINSLKDNE